MKVLFVTLEYCFGTFSGNGVYSQSQVGLQKARKSDIDPTLTAYVDALRHLGHEVLVVAGKSKSKHQQVADLVLEVELPTWGRVDRCSAYPQFIQGCSTHIPMVKKFFPDLVVGVDWTAREAARVLVEGKSIPYVYLNYRGIVEALCRVFLRSCLPEDEFFYHQEEGSAFRSADLTITLCLSDAKFLQSTFQNPVAAIMPAQVLLPSLREDMASLPLPDKFGGDKNPPRERRRYLACCVRLSPEKEPERFVDLVEALEHRGAFHRLKVVPLLCSSTASEFAEKIRSRFRAAANSAEVSNQFLDAPELAKVYSNTLLNFHPPLTEAFGMTVVEAASQGTPSVVNMGDAIGAAQLLEERNREILQLDYTQPTEELAIQVEALLSSPQILAEIGKNAAAKSRSWTALENGKQLAQMLQEVLERHRNNEPPCRADRS